MLGAVFNEVRDAMKIKRCMASLVVGAYANFQRQYLHTSLAPALMRSRVGSQTRSFTIEMQTSSHRRSSEQYGLMVTDLHSSFR